MEFILKPFAILMFILVFIALFIHLIEIKNTKYNAIKSFVKKHFFWGEKLAMLIIGFIAFIMPNPSYTERADNNEEDAKYTVWRESDSNNKKGKLINEYYKSFGLIYSKIKIDKAQAKIEKQLKAIKEKQEEYIPKTNLKFTKKIRVNEAINTNINVSEGDEVEIIATGKIKFGESVGEHSPDGISNSFYNLFNIEQNFNHGCLMMKVSSEKEWISVGYGERFPIRNNGSLMFEVNDIIQSDNSGAFLVTVKVYN